MLLLALVFMALPSWIQGLLSSKCPSVVSTDLGFIDLGFST